MGFLMMIKKIVVLCVHHVHVEGNTGASSQFDFINLFPATDNISGTTTGFDDESFIIKLSKNLSDHLSDTLKSLQVLFSLVIFFPQFVQLDTSLSNPTFLQCVVTQNTPITLDQ